jgi:ATP-dependent DNA helicase RecG
VGESFLGQRLPRVVGSKTAKALESSFGMRTVDDLLHHYPRRYVERGQLTDLSRLRLDEHVTVLARVETATNFDYRRPGSSRVEQRTEVTVTDGTGRLLLTFFRQPWLPGKLRTGAVGMFSGKVTAFRNRRQLTHPDFELFDRPLDDLETVEQFLRGPIPVYAATAQIPSWRIAKAVEVALDGLGEVDDPLPADIRRELSLLDRSLALQKIHRPESSADWRDAQRRLRFEEAFVLQVVLAQRRSLAHALPAQARPGRSGGLLDRFDASLPFALTEGQSQVGAEILADLARPHPMYRLLQGEVGSGKTVVALRAMLRVVDSGGQAALLAPTEVLAAQHHRSISALLGPLAAAGMLGGAEDGTRVALLTGSSGTAARRAALLDAASGAAGLVIGTHALLEERVQFAELGLVVVDEQHRFGVEQRAALVGKAGDLSPHTLVMTATPIPRTVAMTVFGDLDVSTLRELPKGRSAIQTSVVPASERRSWLERGWQRVCEEVAAGHQAYVVCPRIGDAGEGSDDADETGSSTGEDPGSAPSARRTYAVLEVAGMLAEGPLRGLRLACLHGRMPPDQKETVMASFAAGEIDVLVTSTVIEVGVDVANASVMVIMDAERFGVSQLHQLRGRVGRGATPGLCLLVSDSAAGSAARERLEAIAATTDGFEISEVDLRQRREGDLLGAAQSGRRSTLRLLSVIDHEDVIAAARERAVALVGADSELANEPALARAVASLDAAEETGYLHMA